MSFYRSYIPSYIIYCTATVFSAKPRFCGNVVVLLFLCAKFGKNMRCRIAKTNYFAIFQYFFCKDIAYFAKKL
jgi:hypothetical protein